MKVVYVLGTGSGGIPHYTAELANAISRYAKVFVIKPNKTTADEFFSKDVKVINAFKPLNLTFKDMYSMFRATKMFSPINLLKFLSYRHLSKVIHEIDPDIVHFIDLYPPVHIFALKIKEYPIVVTFHGVSPGIIKINTSNLNLFLISSITSVWNLLSSLLFRMKIDKAIVHTKIHKEFLIRRGISEEKIVVIPHGVYNIFKYYKERNNESNEEKSTILFFGNIVWSKALDVLIDAIPLIISKIPDIKLIIAGDGVIPKKCWEIINKYRSNFEIHNYFIPNEKVGEFFSRASIVVIPNRKQDGHSGSLTIAFSFGKPVVTTNVGEFPLLVEKAGCGLVVPPNNPKALAEAIIEILENYKLRKKMSKNALKMAEKISWNEIAKKYIRVYEKILD